MRREGPRITVSASCFNCTHEKSESYKAQGDSGHNVSCTHPSAPEQGYVGDSTWTTPKWCPLLAAALQAAAAAPPT